MNYYNEFKPEAAAMLRQLIKDGLIPNGDVDERSITEVIPSDLEGYSQCHFFAGIGGWSLALEYAGWPPNRPVWTGSCPCQSFSSAGKQKGKEDARHLWPVWFRLIRECRPSTIFGEQVANAITHGWLDEVAADVESEGYAIGSSVLPACSIGAPHRRDRLFFVAHRAGVDRRTRFQPQEQAGHGGRQSSDDSGHDDVVDSNGAGSQGRIIHPECGGERSFGETGLEWIAGADGKSRPIVPGIRLLAHGFPERVACLHGLGNAIVPGVAAEFIKAYEGFE